MTDDRPTGADPDGSADAPRLDDPPDQPDTFDLYGPDRDAAAHGAGAADVAGAEGDAASEGRAASDGRAPSEGDAAVGAVKGVHDPIGGSAERPGSEPEGAGRRAAARSPSTRSMAVLGAAALVTTVLAVIAGSITDRADDEALSSGAAPGLCPSGVDLLAVTVDTSVRDDDLFDGFLSVGVVRTDRPEDVTYLNEDPGQVVSAPSISPTGDQVALTWADGDYESAGPNSESVWVASVDGSDARPLTTGTNDRPPRWSPDGQWIAFFGTDDEAPEWHQTLSIVPAEGGPVRRLTTFEARWRSWDVAWMPDSSGLYALVADDLDAATGTVVSVGLDGERHDIAEFAGWTRSLTVVPGGEEVMVGLLDGRQRHRTVKVDVATGEQREIGGPGGLLRWSADGERAYVLVRDGEFGSEGLYRVAYDGSTFVLQDEVPTTGWVQDFDVGPCADGPTTPDPVDDQPLIGTTWTLGPRAITVTELDPAPGCEPGSCTRVRIERRERVSVPPVWGGGEGSSEDGTTDPSAVPPTAVAPAPPSDEPVPPPDTQVPVPPESAPTLSPSVRDVVCAVYEGELRGTEVVAELAAGEAGDSACWDLGPPETLEVDGSLLHVGYGADYGSYAVTYGALFVGDPGDPVDTSQPTGPATTDIPTTSSTLPTPEVAPCDDVAAYGDQLAGTGVRSDLPPAASPEELAGRARLVVRGLLTGSGLTTWDDGPGTLSLVNDVLVTEVLVAEPGVEVVTGTDIGVVFSFDARSGAMPPLGQDSELPAADGTSSPEGAVPVAAFLTDEGAPHGTWQIDGPDALAVGCSGEPLGGLIGDGPGWDAVADIEDLAERVRDR